MEKSSSGKGKEKRRLEDASLPSRPTKVRMTDDPEDGPAAVPVEEIPLGKVYVPDWNVREGSSVTTPAVATEMFEHSCLFKDLQQLSACGLHVVAKEFATAWAKVSKLYFMMSFAIFCFF